MKRIIVVTLGLRMMAAVLVLVVAGCERSNPLIGKWTIADQSDNNLACISLVNVEFTEKTVTTGFGPTKSTSTVTYGRDGDSYLATAGNGQAFRVKIESGGIEANGCHLVPASGKSNPLIGKWKTAPGQNGTCRYVENVEFAEDTQTMMFTEEGQKAEQLSSPRVSYRVTYGRDGEFYLATSANGQSVLRLKIENGSIEILPPHGSPGGCHFVPAN
jgi:hypothetical protein